MSPLTLAVLSSVTVWPLIWPFTDPQTRTVSPEIEPVTVAASPIVTVRLWMSPSTLPSIWMSPALERSPTILRSALMMEGPELRADIVFIGSDNELEFGFALELVADCGVVVVVLVVLEPFVDLLPLENIDITP
jgi:hypothetical protein